MIYIGIATLFLLAWGFVVAHKTGGYVIGLANRIGLSSPKIKALVDWVAIASFVVTSIPFVIFLVIDGIEIFLVLTAQLASYLESVGVPHGLAFATAVIVLYLSLFLVVGVLYVFVATAFNLVFFCVDFLAWNYIFKKPSLHKG